MAEEIIIPARLQLEIKETERKIEFLKKRFEEAMAAGQRTNAERIGRALDNAIAKLDKLKKEAAGFGKEVKGASNELSDMNSVAGRLARTMAGVFSLKLAKDFAQRVMQTRGQFQQLEIAFETMLGSKEKADKMMSDAVQLAAKTPFDLQGVAAGAKSLLAFGMESDKVIDTLRRLGDVSAGLSLPLGRLTTLYGQTMVKGKLMTRDLLRYQQAGIPLLDELAKQMGKTTTQVRQLVTAGKVGFSEVQKVFETMTTGTGKFANLMEKQSKSITGRISNIQDAIDEMFNEIGEKTEGPINAALDLAGKLVENYEKVGKVIAVVAAAYGIERAALMACTAAQNVANAAKIKEIAVTKGAAAAQAELNKRILANPYVLAAAAVGALTVALIKYKNHLSAAGAARKELADAEASVDASAAKELTTLARLRAQMEGAEKDTYAYKDAKKQIINQFSKYNANLKTEIENVNTQAQAYDNLKKSILDAAKVRVYETFVSSQTAKVDEELTKLLPKIKARIDKHLDPDEAGGMYSKVLQYIYGDTNAIGGLTEKQRAVYTSDIFQEIFGRSLPQWVEDAKQDVQSLKTLNDEAKATFGITDDLLKTYGHGKDAPKTTPEKKEELTDKERRLLYNREKKLEADRKQLTRAQIKSRQDAAQAEIDAMADSTEKKIKQIYLDYDKEMTAIQNEREDMREKLKNEQLDDWLAESPDNKAENFKVDEEAVDEAMKSYEDIFTKRGELAGQKWAKSITDAMNASVEDYGSFGAKFARIIEKWAEKMAGESPEMHNQMKRMMREELESLVEEMASSGEDLDFSKWFNSLADASLTSLQKALEDAQQVLAETQALADTDTGKDYSDALFKANAKIVALEKRIRELTTANKTANINWKETSDVLKSAASTFSELGNTIGGVAGEVISNLGSMASSVVEFANAMDAIEKAGTVIESAAGFVSGVSAAISVLSSLVKMINSARDAAMSARKATRDFVNAMRDLEIERMTSSSNFFGDSAFQSLKTYNDLIADSKKRIEDLKASAKEGVWTTNLGFIDWSNFEDENGFLDGDKLKAFAENVEVINSDIVDEMIREWELYEEATKAVADYMKNIFGNTASEIADKMIDSFVQTGDAMTGLEDIAASVGRNVARSMVTSMLLDNVFTKEKQDEMAKMIVGGNAAGAVDEFNNLLENAQMMAPQITEFLRSLDVDWAGERQSGAKGIAQASQDSVDELNGRFTTIQQHTFLLNESVQVIKQQNAALMANSAMVLLEVRGIHNDTTMMKNAVSSLSDAVDYMREDLAATRRDLSDIVREGVVMKR